MTNELPVEGLDDNRVLSVSHKWCNIDFVLLVSIVWQLIDRQLFEHKVCVHFQRLIPQIVALNSAVPRLRCRRSECHRKGSGAQWKHLDMQWRAGRLCILESIIDMNIIIDYISYERESHFHTNYIQFIKFFNKRLIIILYIIRKEMKNWRKLLENLFWMKWMKKVLL